MPIFRGFRKKQNTPLAKDLERKIYHWLGNPPPPHRGLDSDQNTWHDVSYCGLLIYLWPLSHNFQSVKPLILI